jgi:hypothetical protein
VVERRCALAVGDGDIGAALDEGLDRRDVVWAALAEDHGLDQCRPAEVVDVVDRRAGRL